MPEAEPLLTPELTSRLARLDLRSLRVLPGGMQGERRSKQRGRSVEFADFRPYAVGDDLRLIDWNLYARLDRLVMRVFFEEQDLAAAIVLDVTASMGYGSPTKLRFCQQLAAALGHVALSRMNRTGFFALGDGVVRQLAWLRGKRPVAEAMKFLGSLEAEGAGDLGQAARRLAPLTPGAGVVVLMGDFYDTEALGRALRVLSAGRRDVYALQVLSPEELDPELAGLTGDLRLTDVETGAEAPVTVSAALLRRYRERLEAFLGRSREACERLGVRYALLRSDAAVDEVVLGDLRRLGVVG
ncbi:MAG: DUF58 domain-containing protein [Planctomycetota bacterium]